MTICLAIEGTAHTFSVAIINEKGKILSEVRDMYKTEKGGIIPYEAAKHHENVKEKVLQEALKKAKLNLKNIDIFTFSQGPGLPPTLKVTKDFAKELAIKNKKLLIGVNHLIAHLEIGKLLCKSKDPIFILATGANTQIIAYEGKKYRIFGESLDIGIGNALDKFGRSIGLGFPSGPKIEELAEKGNYIDLPYTVKGMDIAFSGILTEAINRFKKGTKVEDLCFSLQETFFAMLTEVTERALAHCEKNEVLLIGGVAANKKLCDMLNKMCKQRNAKFKVVPIEYSGDNAAMIALTALLQYNSNKNYYNNLNINNIDIKPRWRIDDVEVTWL